MVRCFECHRRFVKFHLIKIHGTQTQHQSGRFVHMQLLPIKHTVRCQLVEMIIRICLLFLRAKNATQASQLQSANNAMQRKREQHKQTIKICANRRRHHHHHQVAC